MACKHLSTKLDAQAARARHWCVPHALPSFLPAAPFPPSLLHSFLARLPLLPRSSSRPDRYTLTRPISSFVSVSVRQYTRDPRGQRDHPHMQFGVGGVHLRRRPWIRSSGIAGNRVPAGAQLGTMEAWVGESAEPVSERERLGRCAYSPQLAA